MINWQPMHTAPNDNRWVLIYDENAKKYPFKLARWHKCGGWHSPHHGYILWPKYWSNIDYPEPFFKTRYRRKLKP